MDDLEEEGKVWLSTQDYDQQPEERKKAKQATLQPLSQDDMQRYKEEGYILGPVVQVKLTTLVKRQFDSAFCLNLTECLADWLRPMGLLDGVVPLHWAKMERTNGMVRVVLPFDQYKVSLPYFTGSDDEKDAATGFPANLFLPGLLERVTNLVQKAKQGDTKCWGSSGT